MTDEPSEVLARLDAIAREYDPSDPASSFDYFFKRLQASAIAPWLRGGRLLELGCATGELTSLLAPHAREYHVVEGSAGNVEIARQRVPGATFVHALWDDFEPGTDYSDVLLVNALEHSEAPVPLLERARTWLQPEGRVHVMVPNGLSFHRLVGAEMGLLDDPVGLTEDDRQQGHFRNYTIDTLQADVRRAGLSIEGWEGIFPKFLPNAAMLGWSWDLVAALARVGRRVPEHCAVLYVVAHA
ncbi:MAG: class I SAM-dependent methyltransferase [Acidimicrobiia bacterium]|nr:class I SAM-dependent methyltransferase [Acidimicrobiia bacterium]